MRDASIVGARFAGGSIVVEGSRFLDREVVRVAFPGASPVPLFAHEARAVGEALIAHADAIAGPAQKKNALAPAATGNEGEDQNQPVKEGIQR